MPAAPTRIVTERLTGEPLCAEHRGALEVLHLDARVMATLGGLRPPAETKRYLDESAAHWKRFGFGLYALHDRDDRDARDDRDDRDDRHDRDDRDARTFAGRAGLRRTDIAGEDVVELAYTLAADHWGRGLATEIGGALLEVAFGPLALDEVAAFTTVTNRASRRVLEKLGFAYQREFERAGLSHVLYRVERLR